MSGPAANFVVARGRQGGVTPRIAYLADGRVHVKLGDEPPRVVDSPFVESARRRDASIVQRNAWKTQGASALVAARGAEPSETTDFAAITGMSPGRVPGELLYVVRTSAVTGLFAFDTTTGEEKRLFHGNQFQVGSASMRPGVDLVVCTLRQDVFGSHIGVMRPDGSALNELTDDALDAAPSWARRPAAIAVSVGRPGARRGRPRRQRRAGGHQELDLERREVPTRAESAAHELLSPRMSDDGVLYYVRRPWNARSRPTVLRLLLNLLLLQFRLLAAIFNWLDFFTVRYSGRSLLDSQGTPQRQLDARQWFVWNNLIAPPSGERRLDGEDADATIPQTWQLVRPPSRPGPEVVAGSAPSFDAGGDRLLDRQRRPPHTADPVPASALCTGTRIDQVVALL